MGITLIIGDCGSGKSLQGALFCAEHMRKGRTVYANLFLKGAKELKLEDLLEFDLGENSVVYIDEAVSSGLGSRGNQYKKSYTTNLIEFFTMYRHYDVKEIIIVSPSFSDVLPIIRDNATEIIFCKKSIFNLLGFNKFCRIHKYLSIKEGEPSAKFDFIPFSTKFYKRKPAYELYDSFVKKDLPAKEWKDWCPVEKDMLDKVMDIRNGEMNIVEVATDIIDGVAGTLDLNKK